MRLFFLVVVVVVLMILFVVIMIPFPSCKYANILSILIILYPVFIFNLENQRFILRGCQENISQWFLCRLILKWQVLMNPYSKVFKISFSLSTKYSRTWHIRTVYYGLYPQFTVWLLFGMSWIRERVTRARVNLSNTN